MSKFALKTRWLLALALVFASSPALGQNSRLEGVAVTLRDEGPGPATPLKRALPDYPEAALARAIGGWVVIDFSIGTDGTVTEASVKKASNPAFESGALEAVRKWTFEPVVREEQPVSLPGQNVTLEFTLTEEAKRALEYAAAAGGNSAFQDGKRQNRNSLSMHREGERFMKALGECLEYYQNQQFEKARESLSRLRMRSLNPIERAKTYRMYAYLDYSQGRLDAARSNLRKAMAENALSRAENAEMLFQIAQLYVSEERWEDVIGTLGEWFAQEPDPNSASYFLLALAHFQNGDRESALKPARQAVRTSRAPKEGWLRLLLALEITNKNYDLSIPLLEDLVRRYPKKLYWVQLSTLQGAMGNYEEALIPLQLAYTQDLLDKDSEYRRLAQLLLYLDLPYRAAEVLRSGIENEIIEPNSKAFELLGNSLIESKDFDKAVGPIEKAAELSETGALYLRLAQVHAQRENWTETTRALKQALTKGDLDDIGEAHFLMGVAHYNQKNPELAIRSFTRARGHKSTRDDAANWLKYIKREIGSS